MSTLTEPRWDLVNDEFHRTIESAARNVARKMFVDSEDLAQEGTILAVTKPDLIDALEEGEIKLFKYRLEQDMFDIARTELNRRSRNMSYEEVTEGADDVLFTSVLAESDDRDYTEVEVEVLLPAIWDESYCMSLPERLDVPDADMPRSKGNPATSNNLAAYIADIKIGWDQTDMTLDEKRALILRYGLGWTFDDIAYNQRVSKSTAHARARSGIKKITHRINNGKYTYLLNWQPESEGEE